MTTLKDVAALAGVAPITVSRVVNMPDSVKEKTRSRVEAAMKQLNYVPNAAAKNLASNRTGVIDVYIPESIDLSNPFVMHLIAGVSEVLSDRMYSMLILRNRKKERMCDGYIVTGLLKEEISGFAEYAQDHGRPFVLFGHTALSGIDCIDVDNVMGARMCAEHLLSLGHRKIAMINVLEDKDYVADRMEGYRQALEGYGIAFDAQDVFYAANSVEGGTKAIQALQDADRYTAFCCATDTIALGVTAELNRIGRSVPQKVSVTGFDGLGHHLLLPTAITTAQQPIYQVGKMLAEALLAKLDGDFRPCGKVIPPTFVLGGSTAAIHG